MTTPPEDRKPGFFSRLFGGGKTPEPQNEVTPPPAAEPTAPAPVEVPAPKLSWWKRLSQGLSRTASSLGSGITAIFTQRKLDADTLQDLEDILIQADLGVEVAARIVETIGKAT